MDALPDDIVRSQKLSPFTEGRLLNGRYRVERPLGRGASGRVYLCRDEEAGFRVALKVLPAGIRHDQTASARLHREVLAAHQVRSEYVANLYDFIITEHYLALVLEYIQGIPLASYVKQGKLFGIRKTLTLIRQLARGLSTIHSYGIIHRDIKLENVLLDDDGIAKITDFGISLFTPPPGIESTEKREGMERIRRRPTKDGNVVGTIHYISPEYLQEGTLDQRTDIYALGILLYELLTGRYPYEFESTVQLMQKKVEEDPPPPSVYRPDCPYWLDEICLTAMERDPGNRYENADVVVRILSERLQQLPIDSQIHYYIDTSALNRPSLSSSAWKSLQSISSVLSRPSNPNVLAPKSESLAGRKEPSALFPLLFLLFCALAGFVAVLGPATTGDLLLSFW